jgi:hypothetical protein
MSDTKKRKKKGGKGSIKYHGKATDGYSPQHQDHDVFGGSEWNVGESGDSAGGLGHSAIVGVSSSKSGARSTTPRRPSRPGRKP